MRLSQTEAKWIRGLPAAVMGVAVLVIAGFSIMTWYSYQSLRAEQWQQAEDDAVRARLAFANHVTRIIDYGDTYIRAVRHVFSDQSAPAEINRHLAEIRAPHAEVFSGAVLALNAQGHLIFHSEPLANADPGTLDMDFLHAFVDDPSDRMVIDPTRMGPATGQLLFRLVRPFYIQGQFGGVLVLGMKPQHITDFYRDLNLGPHAASMLLTPDCRVIAREPAAKDGDFSVPIPGLAIWRGHDLNAEPTGTTRQQSVIDGIWRTFYYAKLPDYPLVVSVGVADQDIEARLAVPRRNLALLALGFAVTILTVAMLLVAVIRANGKLSRANAAIRRAADDVRQSNARLQRTNTMLERSNADLEQFAYVASHDLRTPLRNMTSFAQLLEQRYRDRLDQDGRDFIGFIVGGAEQMSNLISDLLDYSRISRQGEPLLPVAMRTAVAEALHVLAGEIVASGAVVEVGELPVVLGDAGQLPRLFQNLIENALKYRQKMVTPVIHIEAQPEGEDMWRISVSDNGIGIDPVYFEKIFVIFQRLHPVGRYGGTGIGLALAKRIVTRMGGEIGVTSTPGAGSTFFFTAHRAG